MIKFILSIILLSITGCNNQKKPDATQQNEVLFNATMGGIDYRDTTTIIYLRATIYNPSNDTIEVLTKSCGEEMFFDVDNPNFEIINFDYCFSTISYFIKLPPGFYYDFYLMVKPIKEYSLKRNETFNIGMHAIYKTSPLDTDDVKYKLLDKFLADRNSVKLVWSRPIDLSHLNGKIYKL